MVVNVSGEQEQSGMEGSGSPRGSPHPSTHGGVNGAANGAHGGGCGRGSSWSNSVFTLRDISSKYDDSNLPKYLFVHKDYSDEGLGLHLKSGDLLEVFGFHSLTCVKGDYDAGQAGMQHVSIPLGYPGKVRKMPKCEYQFPLAMDLVRHFPRYVRVTFAPRPREGPLGLGEVLELVKADREKEVLHVKRNEEKLQIPLSLRGDFEEIIFKENKDYDLRTLMNNHLCPMWVQLTEMKRIREGFTSFKHFSGEVKLSYVMTERLLLCRVVNEEVAEGDEQVQVMCIPVERVCRNGTSPSFKVPTGILKDSQRMFSAEPDWQLHLLSTSVRVLNFVTNHKASLLPRKYDPIELDDTSVRQTDSPSLSSDSAADETVDSSSPVAPVPPPRRKKQLKSTLSEVSCQSVSVQDNNHLELTRELSGPVDNNMRGFSRTEYRNSAGASPTGTLDRKLQRDSSIPDEPPPPTPPRPRKDVHSSPMDNRPPPPLPRPSPRPSLPIQQSGPPLPPQSSKPSNKHSNKPSYVTIKPLPSHPPQPPTSPRPSKPSVNDHVPPPPHSTPSGYLPMGSMKDDDPPSYLNNAFKDGEHPKPPSPDSEEEKVKKLYGGPLSELNRKMWERQVSIPSDESQDVNEQEEDMYIMSNVDYISCDVDCDDTYSCIPSQGAVTPPSAHGQTHPHPPPPRITRCSASSTSSSATWSSGYNSDTPEGTVTNVGEISGIPHDLKCLSVSGLADSLTLLRLERLADSCRDNLIDGSMFKVLSADELRSEPFNLSGLYLKKALMFKDEGWMPKMK